MLPDNRLDFINDIDTLFIGMMKGAREDFIKIDNKLREVSDLPQAKRDGVNRLISLARTNIETSCMYTIKALCLMGEKMPTEIEE